MRRIALEDIVKCPRCGADLAVETASVCCRNGHRFHYRNGVADFSGATVSAAVQQQSTRSFEAEWSEYYSSLGWSAEDLETEREMFLTYTRAMPSFFSDKIVVDAGCGNGRYVRIVNSIACPPPRLVIACDLSDSIYVAARNCSAYDNVLFFKIDINLLPAVLKRRVDYIYSIGVLHHTPDAHASFCRLAECIDSGGYLSAFIYGKGNPLLFRVNHVLRNHVGRRLPRHLVYWLCVMAAVPAQAFRLKFFGPWMLDFVTRVVFVSPDVHNMFDAYTAGWTSFHDKQTVEGWYRENGMDCVVESQLNHTSLYCIGRKTALPLSDVATMHTSDAADAVGV